jgi:hypothetical protein
MSRVRASPEMTYMVPVVVLQVAHEQRIEQPVNFYYPIFQAYLTVPFVVFPSGPFPMITLPKPDPPHDSTDLVSNFLWRQLVAFHPSRFHL